MFYTKMMFQSTTALFFLLSLLTATQSLSSSSSSNSGSSGSSTVQGGIKTVGNVAVPGLKNGMDYVRLGDSDLIVSKVCMGTMTFGDQNTVEEGVEQLHYAFDQYGINFLDTAEMYPIPTKPETQGLTDQAVAMFLKDCGPSRRKDIIVATKVCGRSERITWLPRRVSNTPASVTREQILDSVDASLERLGIEYIDLLQIHWPDRFTGGLFGQPDFTPTKYESAHPSSSPPVDFQEQLSALQEVIKAGKVRYIGLSNETPYGICSMVQLAKQYPELYPKIISVQNSYSLVVRKDYEAGMAEVCYHSNVGLLPYSPLAAGSLTGKYRTTSEESTTTKKNKKGRLTLFPGFMERYLGSQNEMAVNAYCDVAQDIGLSPAQMALSWCYHNELVTSTIIGATTMEQLEENLKAYDIHLDDETLDKIGSIYKKYTDPTKARN